VQYACGCRGRKLGIQTCYWVQRNQELAPQPLDLFNGGRKVHYVIAENAARCERMDKRKWMANPNDRRCSKCLKVEAGTQRMNGENPPTPAATEKVEEDVTSIEDSESDEFDESSDSEKPERLKTIKKTDKSWWIPQGWKVQEMRSTIEAEVDDSTETLEATLKPLSWLRAKNTDVAGRANATGRIQKKQRLRRSEKSKELHQESGKLDTV
jgi:hypothetical protein